MNDDVHILSMASIQKIDRICDQFEECWNQGTKPQIEQFLETATADERAALLRSLLRLELEWLGKEGTRVKRTTYLRRFESYPEVVNTVFGEVERLGMPAAPAPGRNPAPHQSHRGGPAHAEDNRDRVILTVVAGPHEGDQFKFDQRDTFQVGRSRKSNLCLRDDPHFSRHHFRLDVDPPTCFLVDLGSRNGTFVNGFRVQEAYLKHGDVISGGRTRLQISIVEVPADEAPTGEMDSAASEGEPEDVERDADKPVPPASQTLQPPPLPVEPPPSLSHSKPVMYPTVPGYDVIEELGRGGMGIVYRAVQKAKSRDVALKIVVPPEETREQLLQLFMREADALSQLKHPNIVRLYEIGISGGQLFFAMEYVPAIDLGELLNTNEGGARVRIACAVACDALAALSYAHDQALVHRDIKPSNILLQRSGRKLHTKLADFGLARNYEIAGIAESSRDDDDPRGTAVFMAPEQVVYPQYAKPSCDLYAVGVTLYQYITGKLPFDFTSGRSKFAVVLDDPPIPITEFAPELPPELVDAIHRALIKNPDQRISSAHEMREAILPFTRRRHGEE